MLYTGTRINRRCTMNILRVPLRTVIYPTLSTYYIYTTPAGVWSGSRSLLQRPCASQLRCTTTCSAWCGMSRPSAARMPRGGCYGCMCGIARFSHRLLRNMPPAAIADFLLERDVAIRDTACYILRLEGEPDLLPSALSSFTSLQGGTGLDSLSASSARDHFLGGLYFMQLPARRRAVSSSWGGRARHCLGGAARLGGPSTLPVGGDVA